MLYCPSVQSYGELSAPVASHDTDHAGQQMRLELVTTLCGGGSCPTVYRTNRGTLVVQGYAVSPTDAGISVPAGELLIEIPPDLLAAAVSQAESGEQP